MKKETIVLLPGYDGDGQGTFAKLTSLIEGKYDCLIINYPFYRQTTKSYSLSELNQWLQRVIKAKHLAKFHLLGFSMGGFIATQYAISHPEQILSLTIVSSSVSPSLSSSYNTLVWTARNLFKVPLIAKVFSIIYTLKLLKPLVTKYSPLPLPRDDFPSSEGYPVYGTLANVLYEATHNDQDQLIAKQKFPKLAILFKDDHSFPASTYAPILTNFGFRVIVKERGGHAVSNNYWNQVASSLYR
ncbi:MAG: alpha/beta hydrolase [Microgenomates group bacterium]